jgi:predicted SnoaL-like aldol condensation-catalyzing enzyme
MDHDLEANKQHAIAFYRTAYLGDPSRAVEDYVGAEYIQHNPIVADGKQAFINYFNEMTGDYPSKSIEFVRVIAESDLVALHTHQAWPGNDHEAAAPLFPVRAAHRARTLSSSGFPPLRRSPSLHASWGPEP